MQIVISFPPGFSVEGILLSAAQGMLRVGVRHWDDAAIFQLQHGRWLAENGDEVSIMPLTDPSSYLGFSAGYAPVRDWSDRPLPTSTVH